MTKDEALRLALEALEDMVNDCICRNCINQVETITAIKAALEAKDEPVAHSVVAGALFDFMGWLTSREKRLILSSVDEASPAVEAITEFAKKRNLSLKYAEVGYWMEFLSTPPQQEAKDEPVAWMNKYGACKTSLFRDVEAGAKEEYTIPLYTTSPQRTWVGLTDEERQEWIDAMPSPPQPRHFMVLVNAIESELKDKNT